MTRRLLLDTHVLLWDLEGTRPMRPATRAAIQAADEILVSVVSYIEIGIKGAIGKLAVPEAIGERVRAAGIRTLGLAPDHGLALANLPLHHRDPFDRLLVAQAQAERLTLVSADARLGRYDVAWIDAGA